MPTLNHNVHSAQSAAHFLVLHNTGYKKQPFTWKATPKATQPTSMLPGKMAKQCCCHRHQLIAAESQHFSVRKQQKQQKKLCGLTHRHTSQTVCAILSQSPHPTKMQGLRDVYHTDQQTRMRTRFADATSIIHTR